MTDTSWYPGNYRPDPAYPPHYKSMPRSLVIEDAGVLKLAGKRRELWVRCRDSGLTEWAPLGIKLKVRPAEKPYGRNRVTLNLADPKNRLDGGHWFGDPEFGPGTDWVHIDPAAFERMYLARTTGPLRYLFAHEFGHSLGFGHGGDGIMDQTPDHAVVNDEELRAARAYWRA